MFARQSRWERALTPKAYKKQGRQGEAHRCALFKGVGRSPRPRQPGATGSNAYCLVQRCTTGSTPFVSPPPSSFLSFTRSPNGPRSDTYSARTCIRKLLEHFDIYYSASTAWHFRRNDGVSANKILQTASSERNVELLGTGSLRDSRPGFTACEMERNVIFSIVFDRMKSTCFLQTR